jgi:RimJ/RimL family protein N-acetyltransferase
MITAPVGIELRPLTIPASVDDPDAADFIEMVRVRNDVYREISGHDDHRIAADELLPVYQPDDHERRLVWTVNIEGRMVGRVGVDLPLEGDSTLAFWLIELVRDAWGRGIGSAA